MTNTVNTQFVTISTNDQRPFHSEGNTLTNEERAPKIKITPVKIKPPKQLLSTWRGTYVTISEDECKKCAHCYKSLQVNIEQFAAQLNQANHGRIIDPTSIERIVDCKSEAIPVSLAELINKFFQAPIIEVPLDPNKETASSTNHMNQNIAATEPLTHPTNQSIVIHKQDDLEKASKIQKRETSATENKKDQMIV